MSLLDACQRATINRLLDYGQMVLDGLGLIPGIGEVFDVMSALVSMARGDYAVAALSIAAAIPFAGWAASAAKNVFRHADNALRAGWGAAKALKAEAKVGWQIAKDAIAKSAEATRQFAATKLSQLRKVGADLFNGTKNGISKAAQSVRDSFSRSFGHAAENAGQIIVHPFADGATHLTTSTRLTTHAASPTFGGPSGLFVAPTAQIDSLIASGASRANIEVALGLERGALSGGDLIRLDVANPFARNLSLPTSGNQYFRPGTGLTLGNLNEGIITSPLKTDAGVIQTVVPGL